MSKLISGLYVTFGLLLLCGTAFGFGSKFRPMPRYHAKLYTDGIGNTTGDENKDYRLPKTLTPLGYTIKIQPSIMDMKFTFVGETQIKIKVLKSTNTIVLNSLYLDFNKNDITIKKVKDSGGGETVKVKSVKFSNDTQKVAIVTENKLFHNTVINVTIQYTGVINNTMQGFYRSWYKEAGNLKWLGVTQMEAPYARTVFPCFDEPEYKAPFTMKIAKEGDQVTVSNMKKIGTEQDLVGDATVQFDVYQTTPRMSTYLIAFCVFEFVSVTNGSNSVWVTGQEVADQADYIIGEVQNILNQLSHYTGIKYSLPKMDLIAVPDFSAGAMENWGLTTYREMYLLYKENISTAWDKERILFVVAHEFAHQWFGDLVTLEWWNYTWLNEGFATYFEYYIPSVIQPDWKIMESFVTDQLHTALAADTGNGHPLNANVTSPEECEAVFDVFSYSKGGSVLRMLEYIVGEEHFRKALHTYLDHAVKNTGGVVKPQHLWKAFDSTLPKDRLPKGLTVATLMKDWTEKKGFPIIIVTIDYSKNEVKMKQQQFVQKQSGNLSNEWWTPITCTDDAKQDFSSDEITWLPPKEEISVKGVPKRWILCNVQQKGYYRVNYGETNWERLIEQLLDDHTTIHPINRAQLIDDSFALAEAGYLTYSIPFSLVKYLKNERDVTPWTVATTVLGRLYKSLYYTSSSNSIQKFTHDLLQPVYEYSKERLYSDDKTHVDELLIHQILEFGKKIGLQECVSFLSETFQQWNTSQYIAPEAKGAVICQGVEVGSNDTWNEVFNYYRRSIVPTEKAMLLQSLGCVSDKDVLNDYLNMLIDYKEPSDIRKQDYRAVLYQVTKHPYSITTAIDFLEKSFQKIRETVGDWFLQSFLQDLGSTVSSPDDLEKVKKICSDIKPGSLQDTAKHAIREIERRIKWAEANSPDIEEALEETATSQYPGSTTDLLSTEKSTHTSTESTGPTKTPTTHAPSSATLNQFSQSILITVLSFKIMFLIYYI